MNHTTDAKLCSPTLSSQAEPETGRSTFGGDVDEAPPEPENGRPLSNSAIAHRFCTGGVLQRYGTMLVRKRHMSLQEAVEREEKRERNRQFPKKPRGKVKGFSSSSRSSLCRTLGRIGRDDPPFMVTATFRAGTCTGVEAKGHLDRMGKVLSRTSDEVANVWRLEETTGKGTGAIGRTPHFHMLVYSEKWHAMDPPEFYALEEKLKKAWCRITGDGGDDRMKYGFQIQRSCGSSIKLKNYMLGHHGKKTEQEATASGNHWGIIGRKNLKLGEFKDSFKLTAKQRASYDRITSRMISKRSGRKKYKKAGFIKESHAVMDWMNQEKLLKYLLTLD